MSDGPGGALARVSNMPLDSERLRRVFDAIDTNGDHFLDKEVRIHLSMSLPLIHAT